ncbi:MAG: DUF309 domain-containing protein [Blastocatellia bacterium]
MELPPEYLRGIELFNDGRYFECHEAWETIWLRATGVEREFLHAMIQIAAALLHHERGNGKGAASVYQRAKRRLQSLPPVTMNLDTPAFVKRLEAFFTENAETRSPMASLPQIRLHS